jgi:hypothetical protein
MWQPAKDEVRVFRPRGRKQQRTNRFKPRRCENSRRVTVLRVVTSHEVAARSTSPCTCGEVENDCANGLQGQPPAPVLRTKVDTELEINCVGGVRELEGAQVIDHGWRQNLHVTNVRLQSHTPHEVS